MDTWTQRKHHHYYLNTTSWPDTNNIIRSWDPALGGNPTYCNNGATAGNCKTSGNPTTSVNDGHDAQGNYYSWCAVTAGCKTINNAEPAAKEDAVSSICPKGWRLPSDNNSTSGTKGPTYTGLQTAYNTGNSGSKFINSPLYFPYGGTVSSGRLNTAGSGGFYWSSTAYNGTSAYNLSFSSSSVSSFDNYARYCGLSVRCVAR